MCVNVMEVSDTIIFSSKTWFYSPKYNKLECAAQTAVVRDISAPLRFDEEVQPLLGRSEGTGRAKKRNSFVSPSVIVDDFF